MAATVPAEEQLSTSFGVPCFPLWDLRRLSSEARAELERLDGQVNTEPDQLTIVPDTHTTGDSPSGRVVGRSVDDWDVSSVPHCQYDELLGAFPADQQSLLEMGLDLLNENIDFVRDLFNDSTEDSFLGFLDSVHCDAPKEPIEIERELANITALEKTLQESLTPPQLARIQSAETKLSDLRRTIFERQKTARSAQQLHRRGLSVLDRTSPISTRSRGAVADVPHVLP